jgi:hypothetical protein
MRRPLARAGGTPVFVPAREADGFVLQADEVERRISPRAKVLIVITPNNPTGAVLDANALEALADVARRRNLIVISDEIYERTLYDGARHHSIAGLSGMRERTIVINGFSKSYSMTGFRLGYLAAPADMVEALQALKEPLSICTTSVSQGRVGGADRRRTRPSGCGSTTSAGGADGRPEAMAFRTSGPAAVSSDQISRPPPGGLVAGACSGRRSPCFGVDVVRDDVIRVSAGAGRTASRRARADAAVRRAPARRRPVSGPLLALARLWGQALAADVVELDKQALDFVLGRMKVR